MKRLFALLCAAALLFLCACTPEETTQPDGPTVACTTYPVYMMAQAVTANVEDGVNLTLLVQQEISCLHNYTLTINDMKKIEEADLIAMNGAGLEDFLSDALEGRSAVDCAQGVTLLWNEEEQEEDSHYWLSPANAAIMAENLADAFGQLDEAHAADYAANAAALRTELDRFHAALVDTIPADCPRELITFHDGFSYFADAFGFTIVAAIEEEEGSEASARQIAGLVDLIDQYQLRAVFVERNGSDATAQCLVQERGCKIGTLSMGMSSADPSLQGLDAYEALLTDNVNAILEVYQ